jgi:AmpD protein
MLDLESEIIRCPLAHFNDRPSGVKISVLLIHSIYSSCPSCVLDSRSCICELDNYRVASHYLIGREGDVWSLVGDKHRAWHAGESCLPEQCGGTPGVNDFSIGIELVGKEELNFSDKQYSSLALLSLELLYQHPIRYILGHKDVALPQGRKTDPGPSFSWGQYRSSLLELGYENNELVFSDQLTRGLLPAQEIK